MSFQRTTAINKLLRLSKRKRVVQGGTSAGKTFGIIPILINDAIINPRKEISIVSESIPHLRRGAMKDFLKIMQETNRYNDEHWNRSLLTYTFPNGSFIEFFSADQSDKLRGARRTDLYINEANNVTFESYQQLSIRTSETIWIDFNPTTEFWAHTEVAKDEDAELIILTYKDNEALPETIVKEIEKAKVKSETSSYWANWWSVYGLGMIGTLQGAVFDNWEQISEVPKEAKLLGYGMDFGFTNDPTALVAIYRHDSQFIYDQIIYQKGLTNSELHNLMRSQVDKTASIYADSAEPKTIAELKSYGWRVYPADKGQDSIKAGISKMQNERFCVTSRSVDIIRELRGYVWDTDKTGKSTNKPIDAFNHSIDAIRYYHLSSRKSAGVYYVG